MSSMDFKGGRFFPVVLEDLRQLVRRAAARRKTTPTTFGRYSAGSNSTGRFVNGEAKDVRLRQLFVVLNSHQFTVAMRDPRFGVEVEIGKISDLQDALLAAVQRRGLSTDRARKDAETSGALVSFIRRTYNQSGPDANISGGTLLPFMKFYGLQLVITDELSPPIVKARKEERRRARGLSTS